MFIASRHADNDGYIRCGVDLNPA